jgi:hypothetical protein
MNVVLNPDFICIIDGDDAKSRLSSLAKDLAADKMIPYLGPGLLTAGGKDPNVPDRPEAVAAELHKRAPAPSKIRTNMWSVAQHIEQRHHRKTLQAWMAEIFAAEPEPTPLHHFLADLPLSLIIDSWYDGAMHAALIAAGRSDVKNIQGITRAGEFRDIWTKAYDLNGNEIEAERSTASVLYEPHGGATPNANFLVADSDYVEVLTEIDIQTPLPDDVKEKRTERGFFFIGCRFDDQMLRTYARQIMKRSEGPHFALIDPEMLTKNERRFIASQGITVIDMPLDEAISILSR